MIAHPPWRKLFYELAEKNPDCLLLNFSIKVSHYLWSLLKLLRGTKIVISLIAGALFVNFSRQ